MPSAPHWQTMASGQNFSLTADITLQSHVTQLTKVSSTWKSKSQCRGYNIFCCSSQKLIQFWLSSLLCIYQRPLHSAVAPILRSVCHGVCLCVCVGLSVCMCMGGLLPNPRRRAFTIYPCQWHNRAAPICISRKYSLSSFNWFVTCTWFQTLHVLWNRLFIDKRIDWQIQDANRSHDVRKQWQTFNATVYTVPAILNSVSWFRYIAPQYFCRAQNKYYSCYCPL